MLTTTIRPMTPDERRQVIEKEPLEQETSGWQALPYVLAAILGSIGAVLGVAKLAPIINLAERFISLALIIAFIGGAILTPLLLWRLLRRWRPPGQPVEFDVYGLYGPDLLANQVEVLHGTAIGVARVEATQHCCTEELAYYLTVEEGQQLYLTGEYLDDPVSQGLFPCREFQIIRLPLAQETLAIHCQGTPLPADQVGTVRVADMEMLPADGERVSATVEALQDYLTVPETTISSDALPVEIDPRLRSYIPRIGGMIAGMVVMLAVGLLPISFTIWDVIQETEHTLSDYARLVFLPLLLLIPLFGIPAVLHRRRRQLAHLTLASEALTITPHHVPITVRYILFGSKPDHGEGLARHYLVELPVDVAHAYHLPQQMHILPPGQGFARLLADFDAGHRRTPGTFTLDVLRESAALHLGRAGMVVLHTSLGYVVRQGKECFE